MANTGKNPSRNNTPQSIEFIVKFLQPVLSVMLYAQAFPLDALDQDAKLQKDKQAVGDLVTGWYFKGSTYLINVSAKKLQALYGRPALRIWRKLFVQESPGGYSRKEQRAFDSSWYLNREACSRFVFASKKYLKQGGITPAQVLELLEDIEEMVNGIEVYEVAENDLGYKRLVAAQRKVMSREERRAKLMEAKPLRVEVGKLNRQHKLSLIDKANQRFETIMAGLKARKQRALDALVK